MKIVVAIVLGFFSAILIYMATAMFLVNPRAGVGPSPAFVALVFFGGWAASAYLMQRGAQSVSRVFTRGALIGAAEWLLIGAAGVFMSGRLVAESGALDASNSQAATAGAALGGGIFAFLTGGLAVAMALVCLIVFAVAHFAGREMRDTSGTPSKKCPECAEMVQAEARKCKHCGATFTSMESAAPGAGTS